LAQERVNVSAEMVKKEDWGQFWAAAKQRAEETMASYRETMLRGVDWIPIPSPRKRSSGGNPHSRTMDWNTRDITGNMIPQEADYAVFALHAYPGFCSSL
jgi:hypothetical protein